ncbi:hypothetical protein QQF64_023868 [Cirrhinus molitorella]|uniref:Uncharacterized protein n=1 Tax=Cirrhinus molitorella TaxID=172907 RepID=A0ABR3NKT4_9TELE
MRAEDPGEEHRQSRHTVQTVCLHRHIVHSLWSLFTGVLLPQNNMEEILKQLAEVSVRQQQFAEHLADRQWRAEQEIAALRLTAAQRTPLPDPRINASKLLPKMTTCDDVEAYLQMFVTVLQ